MKISKNGKPIDSVESWFEFAPPKEGRRQWVDERSAKELAKAFWCSGKACMPAELQDLLDSTSTLGHIEIIEAWPEHKIALDSFRGETRNADLSAIAVGRTGTVALTIEAKADESFGELIETALAKAPEPSNIPKRIEMLMQGLFGRQTDLSKIRYQLLHGVAASLIFAADQQAAAAVFVVFEIRGPSCSEENLARNALDLERFVTLLSSPPERLRVGHLSGPLTVPGAGKIPARMPLFIGKAIREVGAGAER
jgi:hypothetical protein